MTPEFLEPPPGFDAGAWLDAVAPAIGLDIDPAVRDRMLAGALVPAAWLIQAQRFRRWYHARMLEMFREVDIFIAPATPCSAPRIGQQTFMVDGREVPLRPNIGIYTQSL